MEAKLTEACVRAAEPAPQNVVWTLHERERLTNDDSMTANGAGEPMTAELPPGGHWLVGFKAPDAPLTEAMDLVVERAEVLR